MKKIFFILILLLLPSISAIKINEVEPNPQGEDSGNEWIELYNKDEINIKEYKLVNNDGDETELRGSFSDYYIYTFNKQWLDNSDERIFLYKNNDLIDETDLFEDDKNNDLTWQLCDGDWEFMEPTKSKKNNCEKEDDKEDEKNEEIFEETEVKLENTELETIKLNTKDIKSEDNKKYLDKSSYAKYGFVIFCVLLGLLFVFKKKRFNKNEFD